SQVGGPPWLALRPWLANFVPCTKLMRLRFARVNTRHAWRGEYVAPYASDGGADDSRYRRHRSPQSMLTLAQTVRPFESDHTAALAHASNRRGIREKRIAHDETNSRPATWFLHCGAGWKSEPTCDLLPSGRELYTCTSP